ncbi:MAG: Rieske (2Fe-2S) protein [Actinomycetota bacterium]|nr:Rieske (2Fe-2S) protein [Actinomycetota bacterium]
MNSPFLQFAQRIEKMASLDGIGSAIQKVVARAIPQESTLKDLLSGTWLGHPLHPLLTDVVVGAWTSAFFLDLLPDERAAQGAEDLIAIGNLAALPTAAAGLSDWAELFGEQRRLGSVHAAGNVTALSLQTLSWLSRRSGKRGRGKLLSLAAMGAAVASAYLGGHISFATGVGVNRTAFEEGPEEWTPVIALDDLPEESLVGAKANDVPVALYKKGNEIYALSDTCPHRGCQLHDGWITDGTVTCPCHGSAFRLADGGLVKGPATVPAPSYETRLREGRVELRVR